MIYSPAKAELIELRIGLLEDMELLLRLGYTDAALEAGKASKHLAGLIAKPYTQGHEEKIKMGGSLNV